ncbi:MAG: hypothetical protein GTO02_17475 [Candidatus Dadabacteria bacterium]|nr:hypothetical protein [Candidatus Dadabacteria bacterium]
MITELKNLLFKLSSNHSSHDVDGAGISDLLIVILAIIVVILSFYLCIKYLVWPREQDKDHIKRLVLSDTNEQPRYK